MTNKQKILLGSMLFGLGLILVLLFFSFPGFNLKEAKAAPGDSCTYTETCGGGGCGISSCDLGVDAKCHESSSCIDRTGPGVEDLSSTCVLSGPLTGGACYVYETLICPCAVCACHSSPGGDNCGVACDDGNPSTCGDNIGCDGSCVGGPCGSPAPSCPADSECGIGCDFGETCNPATCGCVTTAVPPTPTPAPVPTDDSLCTSATGPTTVTTGQAFSWTYVFRNTGTSTWINNGINPVTSEPDNYRLDSPNAGTWSTSWLWWGPNQPNTLPGTSLTTTSNTGTAPPTPGSYPWSWQLQRYKVTTGWLNFGQACSATINVVSPPPTLSVTLTATPSSGPPPLSSILSASVGGTATGTINYSFWWNCTNISNSVATVEAACGALPAPVAGTCASNTNGYKCNAVSTNPQSTSVHSYIASSTAKIIAERDIATPAEARTAITITNSPPTVPSVTVTEPDYCISGPSAFINWTYSDPEGNPQSAYQLQIDDQGSAWNPPLHTDTGKILSSGTSYFANNLLFNVTYKTRVRVWDSLDAVSNWTESGSWKTPKHAYPLVNFTWSPFLSPSANQPIQFTDLTTFYDNPTAVGLRDWEWLFGDGGSSTLQNPSHTYASAGSYNVTETVNDKDGYTCALTKPIGIQRPIPVWREVSPR